MPFPLGPVTVRKVHGYNELFVVAANFGWESSDRSRSYVVRAGAITDFASFPEFLPFSNTLIGEPHEVAAAAVIHDKLYQDAGLHDYSRKQSDQIFREILLEIGVPAWRAALMYYGLRVGGWLPWRKHLNRNFGRGR